jgi:hypothetical protein
LRETRNVNKNKNKFSGRKKRILTSTTKKERQKMAMQIFTTTRT